MGSDVTVTFGGDSSALRSVLNQAGNDVNNFGNTVGGAANGGGATGMISGLQGAIGMLLGPLEQFASRAASIAETFLLWTGMRKMTDEIAAMADGFFDLNNQMERNQYAWKYMFAGNSLAEGTATAQRLADWTKAASLTIPFTRQDMMSGISSLATLLDEGKIEKYMPLVSDLAATMGVSAYGGQGMNLGQTSRAMIMAMEGNWRSMRELKIQEKDLVPFGFNKKDSEGTFFPALQAWAKHKGVAGASKDIADNTWFGMWSSFIDRIQNFQLDTGGSMFKTMKVDLKDLTDWIDGHHQQIEQFANTLGSALVTGVRLVATGVADFAVGASGGKQQGLMGELGGTVGAIDKDGLLLLQGLLGGLQKADVGAGLSTLMKAIQDCLKDKTIQEGLKTLGGVIGMTLGTGLALAANLLAGLVHVIQFIADHQQTLDLFQSFLIALAVIAIPPLIAEMAVLATEMVIATWPFVLAVVVITAVIFAIKELHDHWGDIMTALGNLGSTIGNWIGDLATHAIGWGLTLVNNFLSTFIPKPVLDAVEQMGIGKVFQTIIDAAKQWGGDMISNFADGAKKFWDHTGGAIFNGIGNAIGAIFKHSVPHEGPMAGDDLWMEHFADNLTTGFQRGTPRLLAATMGTAASIAGTFTGLGGAGATMMGGTVSTSYGGSSLSIYGADSFAIRQIIQQELAQQDQLAALQTRRPGGFRRPGGIGY